MYDEAGREVGNPIVKRENGLVSYVRIRRIGIGRAANGDLRAIDRTLTYDCAAYYYGDLFQGFSKEKCSWGELVNVEYANAQVKQEKNKGVAYVGPGIALLYDITNQDVKKKISENNQRTLFGDRLAVTVCERNILKAHYGFTNAPDDGVVEISCWPQVDLNWDSIRESISARSGIIDIMGERVRVEVAEEEVGKEDIEASEGAVDTDDGVNRPAIPEEDVSQEWHPTVKDIRTCYWMYTQRLGKEAGNAKFEELARDALAKHNTSMGPSVH